MGKIKKNKRGIMRLFTLGLKKDIVQLNKNKVVKFAEYYPSTDGYPDIYNILVGIDNHLDGDLYEKHFSCQGFQWFDRGSQIFNQRYERAKIIEGDRCPEELKSCVEYENFDDQLAWIEKNIINAPSAKRVRLIKDDPTGSPVSLTCA